MSTEHRVSPESIEAYPKMDFFRGCQFIFFTFNKSKKRSKTGYFNSVNSLRRRRHA